MVRVNKRLLASSVGHLGPCARVKNGKLTESPSLAGSKMIRSDPKKTAFNRESISILKVIFECILNEGRGIYSAKAG